MQRRTLVVTIEVTGAQLDYDVTGELIGRYLVAGNREALEHDLTFVDAKWSGPRGDAPTGEGKTPTGDDEGIRGMYGDSGQPYCRPFFYPVLDNGTHCPPDSYSD